MKPVLSYPAALVGRTVCFVKQHYSGLALHLDDGSVFIVWLEHIWESAELRIGLDKQASRALDDDSLIAFGVVTDEEAKAKKAAEEKERADKSAAGELARDLAEMERLRAKYADRAMA